MQKFLFIISTLFLINSTVISQFQNNQVASQQIIKNQFDYLPPIDEKPVILEAGVGFGVPYGVFGGKMAIGNSLVSGDIGFGIIPIAWEASFAIGGSIHFLDRYSCINPRITIQYTTTAAYVIIQKQTLSYGSSSTSVFYKEGFPGYAGMFGVDIRLGKMSDLFLSLNVGVVSSAIGNDEVEKKYKQKISELKKQGFSMEDETVSLNTFPKIAVGMSYIIGRSLVLR